MDSCGIFCRLGILESILLSISGPVVVICRWIGNSDSKYLLAWTANMVHTKRKVPNERGNKILILSPNLS